MICDIVKDRFFLQQKARPAEKKDLPIAKDLEDTLYANKDRCIGMAANMIGKNAAIVTILVQEQTKTLINPSITAKMGPYETEEGCLSLTGMRKTTRYTMIEVKYRDKNWKEHTEKFIGLPAQALQHEIDHLYGVLI